MIYIQRKCLQTGALETVDECKGYTEALALLQEYRVSDPYGYYYKSVRACKDWYERG